MSAEGNDRRSCETVSLECRGRVADHLVRAGTEVGEGRVSADELEVEQLDAE